MRYGIIIFIVFISQFCGNYLYSENINKEKLQVYMQMDRMKFYSDEPLVIKMCIKNRSDGYSSFDIYEKEDMNMSGYSTFQPVVYDLDGREAEIIVPYRLENTGREEVLKRFKKRKITLAPNEEFVHNINLKNIYNILPEKKYRVKGYFFPDFAENLTLKSSNLLSFRVTGEKKDPGRYYPAEIVHNVSAPEVVTLALNAEKEKRWGRMLKYINVEKFISSYSDYVRSYNMADGSDKKRVANSFVDFLSRNRDDYILDFRIIRDEIVESRKISYVDAYVERFAPGSPEKFRYRYTLEKFKNIWLIIGLEATVLKGVER